MSSPYSIVGPYGETLYPSPRNQSAKYRRVRPIKRDPKLAITQQDHAEMVSECTRLACGVPVLGGAIRQMAEWAFAGDSWQPIHFGEDEVWGDIATAWLTELVFKNAVRRTPNKSLIKAMQVSAKAWLAQGDDLALFGVDEGGLPKMTIIPASCIGNGDPKAGWWSAQNLTSTTTQLTQSGFGICSRGPFDGFRIYNGIIYDDADEPIAARVLGWAREGNDFVPTFQDFRLGFEHGAHMAFPYDWHGMGRPMPRIASAAMDWKDFQERDYAIHKAIKLGAKKMVIHQLPDGMDAPTARGDAVEQITTTDTEGNQQRIWVESSESGDVTYIGSNENLAGIDFKQPHENIEAFAVRKLRECMLDLGWPFEFVDLSSTGRAPTRAACELANNSLWNIQVPGETRMDWFLKFSIGVGIANGKIPTPSRGGLIEPYLWTFGYPAEISVDQGNDVTATLNRLRYGLTSQRMETARWGHVLKRVRRDRQKENMALIDDAAALVAYAKAKGQELPFARAMELFYQPSPNNASLPAAPTSPNNQAAPPRGEEEE